MMKQLRFILTVSLVITFMQVVGFVTIQTVINIMKQIWLPQTEEQFRFDKKTLIDFLVINHLFNGIMDTSNTEDSALKVACLLAYEFNKKEWFVDPHIDVEKLRKEINSDMSLSAERRVLHVRILDTCIDQVKESSNQCEMVFKLTKCMLTEQHRKFKE